MIKVTIHETIIVKDLMRWLALLIFKISGWRTRGKTPDIPRYVIIAAPHTSNWDFIYTLCLAFIYRLNPVIMMKKAWFRWPLGSLFRWLGAMPVDRSKTNSVVAQSIAKFGRYKNLVLVVSPAGTRERVLYWKTGFYYIAHGADVPIVLGYLDYKHKVGGFGPMIQPTGDIEADMAVIRNFYQHISGKYPLKTSRQRMVSSMPTPDGD